MRVVVTRALSSAARRFRLRSLEWEHSIIAVGFGITIMLNPVLLESPSFSGFIGGATVWGGIVTLMGVLGIIALIINGTVPRPTAIIRTMSAAAQIFLFLMLCAGFLFSGTGSTGVWTYLVLGLFGFPASAWALLDAVAPEYHG